jgi:hypothetical protein
MFDFVRCAIITEPDIEASFTKEKRKRVIIIDTKDS